MRQKLPPLHVSLNNYKLALTNSLITQEAFLDSAGSELSIWFLNWKSELPKMSPGYITGKYTQYAFQILASYLIAATRGRILCHKSSPLVALRA